MKKFSFIIGILLVAMLAISAFAAGNLPWNTGKPAVQVQNIKAIAPTAGKSRCDTATGTKAIQKSYSSSGYLTLEAQAVDSSGSPVVVKWEEDGKQVWTGSTFASTNSQGNTFSTVTYKAYSGASRTLGSCVRRQ